MNIANENMQILRSTVVVTMRARTNTVRTMIRNHTTSTASVKMNSSK
jgi:hypothetical protein